MIYLKNIFTLKYHPKLIATMAESTMAGSFAANIIVAAISAFIVYAFLPYTLIYIWIFLHLSIFIIRIYISEKLLYFLQKSYTQKKIEKYLIASLAVTSITAVLYSTIVWSMYIYQAPDLHLLLMILLIVTMAASSISTLVSVIIAFILFVSLTVIPLVILGLFQNEEIFLILSFILLGYIMLHILFGYRQYLTLRNTVFLEETFKSIYDKSSDGVILIKDSRLQDCNQSAVKLFGYETKELFLTTELSLLMPKYQPDGKRSIIKMIKMLTIAFKRGSNSFEWLHSTREGKLFWSEIVLTKITLDGEEMIHGVWRNIEDRKKLEIAKEAANQEIAALNKSLEERVNEEVEKNRKKDEQLLLQSRMAQMGEMISMIAHQWRQPLAAISATSASIELKAGMNRLDNETAKQKARDISNFSQHLSSTIDDFRNFFAPNKKKGESTYDEIIKSVLEIIETSIKTHNIELIQELNCHKSFYTYPNELRQVVLNLIKNAEDVLLDNKIKDPYIKIVTFKENDRLVLTISDNGGGIPENIIKKVFNPYFSTKTKKDGTGLGLYMSKTIIEEHCSGSLTVDNHANGAIFTIKLDPL